MEAYGVKALPCQVDVRDDVAVENMVKKTVEAFGSIDILIANSGVSFNSTTAFSHSDIGKGFMVEERSRYSYEKI